MLGMQKNRESFKNMFRMRYKAKCEQIHKSYIERLADSIKTKYRLHSAKYRAASALHYSQNQIISQLGGREEYALCQPKPAVLQQYVYALKNKLMHDSKSRALLRDSFKSRHEKIAQTMSRSTLTVSVCCIAADKIIAKALKLCKIFAGKLLKNVRQINSMKIACNDLGKQSHSVHT